MDIRPYCKAAMADVRIYDRKLAPTEVAQLANRGLEDGLVAWWLMEYRDGNTIPDVSGSGNALQINGAPSFAPVPQLGGTFVGDMVIFNDDGTLVAQDSNSLDLLQDWSISLWVREDSRDHSPNPNPTNGWIDKVRAYHDSEGGWSFVGDDRGVWLTTYGSPNFGCDTPDPLTLGTWYRMTATYDQPTQTVRIYQNSVCVKVCTGATVLPNVYALVLGGNIEENMDIRPYCKAAMADVRIYDRTLTPLNVAQLARRPGDMNCDGAITFDDIDPFVLALSDPVGYGAQYPNCDILNGDCGGDGQVTFDDINPFLAILSGN
jgi:hypothetical protein